VRRLHRARRGLRRRRSCLGRSIQIRRAAVVSKENDVKGVNVRVTARSISA
jgi:hypothetical protein